MSVTYGWKSIMHCLLSSVAPEFGGTVHQGSLLGYVSVFAGSKATPVGFRSALVLKYGLTRIPQSSDTPARKPRASLSETIHCQTARAESVRPSEVRRSVSVAGVSGMDSSANSGLSARNSGSLARPAGLFFAQP